MSEIYEKSSFLELQAAEKFSFFEIKPSTDMSFAEAKEFVKNLFRKSSETKGEYYTSFEERCSYTPKDGSKGYWEGERGESKYISSDQTEQGKVVKNKLAEYGLDGIEYKNGEPDFAPVSKETVKIENMTEKRYDYYDENGNRVPGNFSQADEQCAKRWNELKKDDRTDWAAKDVRDRRHENNYSWHERCDTRTMDLVPGEIHSYYSHLGGVAECKKRDAEKIGGGFDAKM